MKVLEFFPINKIKPIGGPAGYLFNLKNSFQSESISLGFLPPAKDMNPRLRKLIKPFKPILNDLFFLKYVLGCVKGASVIDGLDSYDAVHFHTTYELAMHREQLKGFKGKVIVTSHSPCPMHLEIYWEQLSRLGRLMLGRFVRKKAALCDKLAFDGATHILFPCEEAEEPYYHLWDEYAAIHARNSEKYIYLLSGSMPKEPKISPEEIRQKINIPKDDFMVCYAGRHNVIKGYDALKEIASIFLQKEKGWFVICGKKGAIKPLKNPSWIEIGWTNIADSYINAADCFVLPNRETYFDLIFLEVLSLGRIIVASRTGGNKIFEKRDCGVFLYDSLEEAVEILKKIAAMSKEQKDALGHKNKTLFDKEFSARRFADRYEACYRAILCNDNDKAF